MKNTFSAGPWEILPEDAPNAFAPYRNIYAPNAVDPVCDVGQEHPGEVVARTTDSPRQMANALLLAASPTLLANCKAALAALSQPATLPADVELARINLRAAIAKAEGG